MKNLTKSILSNISSLLLLGAVSTAYAGIDISVVDNKIVYNSTVADGTLKKVYIYKNGKYIQSANSYNGTINAIDSGSYQVIEVIEKNGKISYISSIKDIVIGDKNISPTATLEMSLNNKVLTFNNNKSFDSDGIISSRGFYIYDSTGKCIKVVNGSSSSYDFSALGNGKYQIISWVIDNKGTKNTFSEFFDVKDSTINYTEGTKSTNLVKKDDKQLNYNFSFHSKIGTATAYAQGWTGNNVKVAILDSGIDYNHTDLNDNIVGVYSVLSYNDIAVSGFDDNKHGTMVAGIIGAEANGVGVTGVAYDADLISIKVLNNKGSGSFSSVAEGLKIATAADAKVVNISIGGISSYNNAEINQVYKDAIAADTSIVVAAGNQNSMCTNNAGGISGCSYPAVLPILAPELLNGDGAFIVVGSVDKNGNKASYSNSAGILKNFFMVAPGGNVSTTELVYTTTTGGGYAPNYGTSFSAPMVTGAFALLAQKYPYLKGTDIANILFASATDLGAVGVDEVFGHGLLNIDKAMQPVGTLKLPTTKNINNVAANSSSVNNTGLVQSASMGIDINLNNVLSLDSYNRGFNTKINKTKNDDSYSKNNFRTLEDIYGTRFILGLDEDRQNALLGYKIIKNENSSLKVLVSKEDNVFGSEGTGATSISGSTYYSTLEYTYNDFSISGTYGYSNPEFGGYFKEMTVVQGFGADVNYKFGNFKIGAELPMRVQSGSYTSEVPTLRNATGDIEADLNSSSLKTRTDYKVYAKYEMNF